MSDVLSSEDLDLIFREARTHSVWLDKPVEDALLEQVYDLAKMGPTSANMCPMRIILVKSREAKERLKPALDAGNVDKTMKAPVTAIIGMDIHFYEKLPKLFPCADAKSWFKDLPENVLEYIALRNSSLQGAYFMLAARRWGSIAARCRGSTTQRWTRRSSRGRRSNPISFATSVTAMRANSIHAHRASALRGVIAPVPGIMRLFWAFSSSNPPESPSQEDSSLANMLDTLEARCRSDGPPAGPRSIDPLPGSRSFLTVSAVA